MSSPKPHFPCVVFGMPAEAYHADPSLGASSLKALLVDPFGATFDYRRRNPLPDTPAFLEGRAVHTCVLEGVEQFEKRYAQEPAPSGYPGCLVTLEDLKAFCRANGDKVSGTKAELAALVKARDPKQIVFDDIMALFRAMVERDNMSVLKPEMWARVKSRAEMIALNPHLARAFRGGVPEVSVFWQEDGIPLKARFDYLKPRTIIDLKTFSNARGKPIDVAIKLAISEYSYDVQACHYLDGYRHFHALVKAGCVDGECPLPNGWEDQISPPDDISWTWIFTQTDVPLSIGRWIKADSPYLFHAEGDVARAKQRYAAGMERFGDSPWVSQEEIRQLTEHDQVGWKQVEEAA